MLPSYLTRYNTYTPTYPNAHQETTFARTIQLLPEIPLYCSDKPMSRSLIDNAQYSEQQLPISCPWKHVSYALLPKPYTIRYYQFHSSCNSIHEPVRSSCWSCKRYYHKYRNSHYHFQHSNESMSSLSQVTENIKDSLTALHRSIHNQIM